MPIYSQICPLVSEEKIFQDFAFGNQNPAWIFFIWASLIEDHPRIIYMIFYQNWPDGFRGDVDDARRTIHAGRRTKVSWKQQQQQKKNSLKQLGHLVLLRWAI